ncbi:hypothetical protein E2562_023384 [Oryza meyeriana var. granulata]|uniref:Uncharacterized protein n=1 Tax=Oryza meyeriana var. granulata TaxID=110450 RepID=A0A6G1E0W9_9ORYZ|nr:hypothetical protein E2562_023384 [Oryza meyeriana var. granulata]
MAATAGLEDSAAAGVTDEAKLWWLRFNNGAVDDDDDEEEEDDDEEEDECDDDEEEGGQGEGVAAGETEEKSCAEKESSPRSCGGAPGEEVSEDDYAQFGGGLGRRKRKATVTRHKLQISKVETPHKLQNSEVEMPHKLQLSKVETPHKLQISDIEIKSKEVQDARRISQETENLRLQLTLKTKELEQEENQRLKLELDLKNKEIESLRKQNDELKAENEYYKKTCAVKATCKAPQTQATTTTVIALKENLVKNRMETTPTSTRIQNLQTYALEKKNGYGNASFCFLLLTLLSASLC